MDTGIPQNAVQSHLAGCPDCTEWSSLLKLLGAQPRVQAPADFDARLQARLASEEVKLLALVNSLPPVNAPADFNFRLRARLAQAKAEKAAWSPLAWLAEFWANSFSLGQAATAMAAVALIVAFSAVQLTRHNNQPVTSDNMAMAKVEHSKPSLVAPPTHLADITPVVRNQAAQAIVRVPRQAARKGFVSTPAADRMIASSTVEQAVFDSAKRQETKIPNIGVAYGQQLVNKTNMGLDLLPVSCVDRSAGCMGEYAHFHMQQPSLEILDFRSYQRKAFS